MVKQPEQVIPPLLPLEYCRLERAANMLKCEAEDIIHWGVIGAIELGILIPRTKPKEVALIVEKGLWPIDSNPLERELGSIGSSPRKDKGPWENNGVSWLFSIEPEDTNSSLNGAIADSFTGIACGLFAVTDGVLIDIESQGYYSGDLWIAPADTYEDTDQAKISCLVMADKNAPRPRDVIEKVTLKSQDLWITRQQLEKLNSHLESGLPLPNIYSDPEHGRQAMERLSGELMPRYRQPTQEDLVLSVIVGRGLDPLALPMWESGKSGIKADLKGELLSDKPEVFTEKTFKKTWERLMADGRIAYLK